MIYALLVRESDAMADRAEIRRGLDDALAGAEALDPATWGTSPQAQAAMRTAEAQFGPQPASIVDEAVRTVE